MTYLVTGAAGLIGNFVAPRLCQQGHDVIGLDHLKGSQINVSDNIDLIKKVFLINSKT
jgi:nucleoside-diphosphate-sugar epimerase